MTNIVTDQIKQDIIKKLVNLDAGGDTIKIALFTSGLTTASHTSGVYGSSPLNANEVSSSGTGYTTGGNSLSAASNSIITANAPSIGWTNTANSSSTSWTNATWSDARYAVVYDTNDNNHVIAIIDFLSTYSVTASTFKLNFDATGILVLA